MNKHFKVIGSLMLLFLFNQNDFAQSGVNVQENAKNQSPCGTESPSQQWEETLQKLIQNNHPAGGAQKSQALVYTIPVIIHVIHGGQAVGTYPNLAQGQLNSQIQVLNDDYGGIGFNSATYPSTAFVTYAANQSISGANLDVAGRIAIANTNIQFCLATKDTLGNILAEPGIERLNYVTRGWTNPTTFTSNTSFQSYFNANVKPQTIWNVSKYLNIWVSDLGTAATLLGYATFPPFSTLSGLGGSLGTATTDGFWCKANAFGSQGGYSTGTYASGYTRGRTSTHEIGHWLGLRHTWGDGTCATDYCLDTPPAFDNNFGSPSYPLNATGTQSCSGAVNGAMFMNFMDYTNDPVKYMFTTDQATRIKTAMLNCPYRKFLGTHNLCTLAETNAVAGFVVPAVQCGTAAITLTNTSQGTPVPSYSWSVSGGLTISPNTTVSVPSIAFPSFGTYTVTLTATNGTTSVISKTIGVYPSATVTLSGPSAACYDELMTLTAGGAITYTWLPPVSSTNVMTLVATGNQTVVAFGTDANKCRNSATVTIAVSECVGVTSFKNDGREVRIFPNPLHDKMRISLANVPEQELAISIADASGRIVTEQSISVTADHRETDLDMSALAEGIYFLRVRFRDGGESYLKFVKN